MNGARSVTRVAHAYGNQREALEDALAAPIDMIEADLWYRAGEVWIRHERRYSWLPILGDRRSRAVHAVGRFAVPMPRGHFIRPDIDRMTLGELLARTAGRKRLLLDTKARKREESEAFARKVAGDIERHGAGDWVSVCGQYWPVIRDFRRVAPHIEARYSIEWPLQWERFLQMAPADEGSRRVCIEHRFMTPERGAWLEGQGVDVYCWTVDQPAEASALVGRGVDGIISNDLALLSALPR